MKLLLISLAIYYCLPCAYAVPTTTPSVQQFDAVLTVTVMHSDENKDINAFLSNLEFIDKLPRKIKTLIDQLKIQNNKWHSVNKDLEVLYKYFMDHVTEYKTSQIGVYNFPSDKVYKIVNDFNQILSILKAFQNILTKLNGGGNSGLSGLSGLLSTSANAIEGDEIKEFGPAVEALNSYIKFWGGGQTMGSKTAIKFPDLANFIAPAEAVLPNYYTLVEQLVRQILTTQQS